MILVMAVSPQVSSDVSNKAHSRLPLHSSGPQSNFQPDSITANWQHQIILTEVHMCEQLAHNHYLMVEWLEIKLVTYC